jgi:hypothetical protein
MARIIFKLSAKPRNSEKLILALKSLIKTIKIKTQQFKNINIGYGIIGL